MKKLPQPEVAVNKSTELYIMIRGTATKNKIIWEDLVDVNKVYTALKLLKERNEFYSSIILPSVPAQLLRDVDDDIHYEIAKSVETDKEEEKRNSDKISALLTQVPAGKEEEYEQFTIYPLHEKRKNVSATSLYQMLKVNAAPIDCRDKAIDVKCFPDLYADGKFGQFHIRQEKLTSSEYIKCRLTSKYPQFRLNQQYLFFLLNEANIRQLNSGIFYKLNIVNQKEKLTAKQYLEMLDQDKLESDLMAIFGRLRNTEQYWRKPRNDVACMTRHYGPATWFLTISPSEWMWDDLGLYIKQVNGPEMKNKTTSELVSLDPVSASRFIDLKFKAILDFLMSGDEPLGKIEHYFWRREYQSRGAQHFHLILWVHNAPILNKSSIEEVAQFISRYITCAIPDANKSPILHQRVLSFQQHKHNSYCMRKKKTKKGFVSMCRFSFPRPISKFLSIKDVSEAIAARKTLSPNSRLYNLVRKKEWQMINDYNATLLLAWNGNMDIQYVGEKTAVLNYYITKYTTKSEKTHLQDSYADINSTKSLRSRLFNIGLRALSHRECGALEASDTLLSIPLYGTDPHTTIRWLDVNMYRNRRVKAKSDVNQLDPESTDIFYASWVDNYYPERPEELENVNLYDFARFYDIVKSKPVSSNTEVFVLVNDKKYLKRRQRPYLINHYQYDCIQMPENFYFSMLIMFKPWRDLSDIKIGCKTYAEAFNVVKNDIRDGLKYSELQMEMKMNIEKAFDLIQEKVQEVEDDRENNGDDGPDNFLGFHPEEAANAMVDFKYAVDENTTEDVDKIIGNLNEDQRRVFDMVTNKLSCHSKELLRHFVSGTGGTGKSYLIKAIRLWVQKYMKKIVAVCAPTGIAAFNINGLTIHRLLQLPIEHKFAPNFTQLSDQVLKVLRNELKDVILVIIDEVSMISNITLVYIHLRLTEIFDTADEDNGWFGKRHILLLGDLLQLPPVRENSPFVDLMPEEISKFTGSLNVPNLWKDLFTYDELTYNMRQINDSTYVEMLKRIRMGMVNKQDLDTLSKKLIPMVSGSNDGRLDEISCFISGLPENTVCLLPTRAMCEQLNASMLNKLDTPDIQLLAKDTLDCPKFLFKKASEALNKSKEDSSMTAGLEKMILIKKGARVILRRNIDVSLGLVNGSIGTVLEVKRNVDNKKAVKHVKIRFNHGLVYDLQPVKTKFELMNRVYVHREQFPISLAYAITIHKSQGLSLVNAVLDIGSSLFSCGQAYVALSRVTSLDGIHLINFDVNSIKVQESALMEYNRLRLTYRPDLPKMTVTKTKGKIRKDREWALRKVVLDVQKFGPQDNKQEKKKTKNVPVKIGKRVIKKKKKVI